MAELAGRGAPVTDAGLNFGGVSAHSGASDRAHTHRLTANLSLAGLQGRFVTGQAIHVNGGMYHGV